MPKDSKTRKAEFRARRRAQGYKRVEFDLLPGEKEKIEKLIREMRK